MEDHIEPMGWALGLSGVAVLIGAWVAYGTGERWHGTRTHMDATIVLGVLGLVLLGNVLATIAYGRDAVRRRGQEAEKARVAAEEDARRRRLEELRAQQRAEQ